MLEIFHSTHKEIRCRSSYVWEITSKKSWKVPRFLQFRQRCQQTLIRWRPQPLMVWYEDTACAALSLHKCKESGRNQTRKLPSHLRRSVGIFATHHQMQTSYLLTSCSLSCCAAFLSYLLCQICNCFLLFAILACSVVCHICVCWRCVFCNLFFLRLKFTYFPAPMSNARKRFTKKALLNYVIRRKTFPASAFQFRS